MIISIFNSASAKKTSLFAILAVLISGLMASCISLDGKAVGTINNVESIKDVSILVDRAVDKHIAIAFRNDSNVTKSIMIRPVGGDIGYDTGGGTGFAMGYGEDNIKAAYLLTVSDFTLEPGEEKLIDVFLRNWYYATMNFTSTLRVDVLDGKERYRLEFPVSQEDVFDNPKKMFQDNKLGRNDPNSYASVQIGADSLPANFTIKIPVKE